MKKHLLISSMVIFSLIPLIGQNGRTNLNTVTDSRHTISIRSTQPAEQRAGLPAEITKTVARQYADINPLATDVIINNNPAANFRHVRICTAFNGWIYAVYTINDATGGGLGVSRSKDNGVTWNSFMSFVQSGLDYLSVDVEVAGTDTNNLNLFVAGILNSGGNYIAWVDKYNATTGAIYGEYFNESFASAAMLNIALATDYIHPSYLSTGFSVAVAYTMTTGPADSLVYAASIDGGNTYSNRQVYATGAYLRTVSLAYGYSAVRTNGRYFIAFESRNSGTADVGNIGYIYTATDPASNLSQVIFIDSTDSGMRGRLRYPSITCQNEGANNDSSDIAVMVSIDRQFNSTDWDELTLFSQVGVNGSSYINWHRLDIDNTGGTIVIEGNSVYSPADSLFKVTYFDSTAHHLVLAKTNARHINAGSVWTWETMQYNDVATNVVQPYPQVAFAPTDTAANLTWNAEGTSSNGVPMFDREAIVSGIVAAPAPVDFAAPYPNPANEMISFNYNVATAEQVVLEFYDVTGKLQVTYSFGQLVGEQKLQVNVSGLPAGMYLYRFVSRTSTMGTGRIVVAH